MQGESIGLLTYSTIPSYHNVSLTKYSRVICSLNILFGFEIFYQSRPFTSFHVLHLLRTGSQTHGHDFWQISERIHSIRNVTSDHVLLVTMFELWTLEKTPFDDSILLVYDASSIDNRILAFKNKTLSLVLDMSWRFDHWSWVHYVTSNGWHPITQRRTESSVTAAKTWELLSVSKCTACRVSISLHVLASIPRRPVIDISDAQNEVSPVSYYPHRIMCLEVRLANLQAHFLILSYQSLVVNVK